MSIPRSPLRNSACERVISSVGVPPSPRRLYSETIGIRLPVPPHSATGLLASEGCSAMKLNNLSKNDLEIIKNCLIFSEDERLFPEWEFETLFGISREQFRAISRDLPAVDSESQNVEMAVIGCLNHILGYLHMSDKDWKKNFSFSHDQLLRILRNIK